MNNLMSTKVIVIHDDISEISPIMVMLKVKHGEENVLLFTHSQDGLDYVLKNLGCKMIVLLDKNFKEAKDISGIRVFEKIREKTSLVYIILITVSKITELDDDELKMLINKDLFKFESFTSDYTTILNLVDEAILSLSLRIDCVIEEWIMKHPDDARNKPLIKNKEGVSFTMNEVMQSIREESEVGIEFERSLLKLAIEIFSRQPLRDND
ncbi:hypothetical protein SGQ44_00670 [Flavobacterium sp. Fl-77]|uniref:Uncharacterized protein n=1 Tax=Flavobacterium flavipigmentatum TaxID=2893884 RepID=A0AAJ2SD01_9FLAO|nr:MULTISPECIES: hypothetical protein [unclassified Flavobacterium]MDX6180646.1 hypothetical protein [Flavobacterium sp. Fl-33]MDX6184246.1 hypothetical protein [Flavobacterium sp. Fl-77]UFH39358.1 hypothetical protein LNP22_03570 [Flavobacterium sp. F-70]